MLPRRISDHGAGPGTAVLFPTLVGIVSRNVGESFRGRATSVVTTVSYLGFIVGPVYVGLWADAVGLRGAMLAVAALGLALLALITPLLRRSDTRFRLEIDAGGVSRGHPQDRGDPRCAQDPSAQSF